MVRLAMPRGRRGHIAEHDVRLPAEALADRVRCRGIGHVELQDFGTRQWIDFENIDGDQRRPAGPFGSDLGPAARRRAEVYNAFARPQHMHPVIDLDKLPGRARTVSRTFRLRDIGIVELPLEPPRRGRFSSARRLYPNMQTPGSRPADARLCSGGVPCP